MAAALLTTEKVHLDNFPTELIDARVKADFLTQIGVDVVFSTGRASLDIQASDICSDVLANYDFGIRTTYLLAAGQLARTGCARIPYPGGCRIGARKYDLHMMVWERMGCSVKEMDDHIEIRASRLRPAEIVFPFATVGGTENALLCASTIEGTTIIRNAYVTPEIEDLIYLLRKMGASIDVLGNSQIHVYGSNSLRGTAHQVIPDRIEALTWIIYSVLAGGTVIIEDVPFGVMEVPWIHLKEAGVDVYRNSSSVYVDPVVCREGAVQPFEVACGTYPGVISDMQPFWVLLALKAEGVSQIIDYRYPDRVAYLTELSKLCGDCLAWSSGKITVHGPAALRGAEVQSTDLRGSMALVLGGLLGEGTTRILDVEMALRGYDKLLFKLSQLGIEYRIGGETEMATRSLSGS